MLLTNKQKAQLNDLAWDYKKKGATSRAAAEKAKERLYPKFREINEARLKAVYTDADESAAMIYANLLNEGNITESKEYEDATVIPVAGVHFVYALRRVQL